jgi:dinuclear metal center YbgI/SA1388 family protein
MTTVREVVRWLEGFAPRRLAESWDNVGLLLGDPDAAVERLMTCLTVTPDTAAEAISDRAGLIVSHHPILFRPAKAIRADRADGAVVWGLARAGVAVASPHTAFDGTAGGINELLAERLGLAEVRPLRPAPGRAAFKVVVFTPESDREAVLNAAFAAGAGRIGDYEQCSFAAAGQGTFFGTEGTNPTVGQAGRRESADEWRLEFICPDDRLAAVLGATRGAHSYEEPAIDVFPVHVPAEPVGAGRVGGLERPEPLGDLAARVAALLDAPGLQFAGDPARPVRVVAICCGAGDDFLDDALRAGADALLTGEARFHRALEAEARGIGLIAAGHHATERPGVERLADRLGAAFPTLAVWPSRRERDPWRGLMPPPGKKDTPGGTRGRKRGTA